MAKPTTIRIPDDLLDEIDQHVKELNLDRSAYLRDVLRKGFLLDRQERILEAYRRGGLTLTEASHRLGCDPWSVLSLLKMKKLHLNVQMEDWLDSSDLERSVSRPPERSGFKVQGSKSLIKG